MRLQRKKKYLSPQTEIMVIVAKCTMLAASTTSASSGNLPPVVNDNDFDFDLLDLKL